MFLTTGNSTQHSFIKILKFYITLVLKSARLVSDNFVDDINSSNYFQLAQTRRIDKAYAWPENRYKSQVEDYQGRSIVNSKSP